MGRDENQPMGSFPILQKVGMFLRTIFVTLKYKTTYLIFSGVPLSICPSSSSSSGGTCCTKEMESNLMTWSSQQFKLALDKRASQISNTLRAKMAKIEGNFMFNFITFSLDICILVVSGNLIKMKCSLGE